MNLFCKGVVYSLLFFLFITYSPPLVETIDPCSATPSYEYSNTIFIIIFYTILFLILGSFYTSHIVKKKYILLILVFLLPIISFFFSYIIISYLIHSEFLSNNNIINYIRTYDECYNNKEVKEIPLNILCSIILFISSYLTLKKKVK